MTSLTELIAENKVAVEKQVAVGGKTVAVFFRRITAGQREQLLKGQKVSRSGSETSFELDLALNEAQRQKFVLYTVCNADGTPFFKDVEAVRAVDSATVQALYAAASSLEEADDPEKA